MNVTPYMPVNANQRLNFGINANIPNGDPNYQLNNVNSYMEREVNKEETKQSHGMQINRDNFGYLVSMNSALHEKSGVSIAENYGTRIKTQKIVSALIPEKQEAFKNLMNNMHKTAIAVKFVEDSGIKPAISQLNSGLKKIALKGEDIDSVQKLVEQIVKENKKQGLCSKLT